MREMRAASQGCREFSGLLLAAALTHTGGTVKLTAKAGVTAVIALVLALACAAGGSGSAKAAQVIRPLPAALVNHPFKTSFTPQELYTWRFPSNDPGGSHCDPANVTVNAESVTLNTNGTSSECGVIQSPRLYPTTDGYVYEARVDFSAVPGTDQFADWAAYWMYGNNWPVDGEIDAVETTFGTQFVSYHYGTDNSSVSTCNYVNGCDPNAAPLYPESPNIKAGWHTVDIAFGGKWIEIFYDGRPYVAIKGNFVTAKPSWIVFSDGSSPSMDQPGIPGTVKIAWLRIFT